MSLSNTFITRPVLTTVCSLLIVIAGLIAIPILPIENLPDIAPPTVQVSSRYVGADAVSVEQGVTSVLEQQINGVENMDFISSTSAADGTSAIEITFASGSNGDINQVNVQNRVALAQPSLPEEVRQSGITVNQASNSILLVYNFTSEDPNQLYSLETISGLLDQNLTDAIRRVPGWANCSISVIASWPFASGSIRCASPPTSSPPAMWCRPCAAKIAWCRWGRSVAPQRPPASNSPSPWCCRADCATRKTSRI